MSLYLWKSCVGALCALLLGLLPTWRVAAEADKQVYIVYMGGKPSGALPQELAATHVKHLASLVGSEEAAQSAHVYSYKTPGVVSVFPSQPRYTTTTRSWEFLGLGAPSGLWSEGTLGQGVIVGLLDTGIWPEAASFLDDSMPPVPHRWKGECVLGEKFDPATDCNNKIIGAKFYNKAFEIRNGPVGGYRSARDDVSHGTHTTSIAAGRRVAHANFSGLAGGTAQGGAPLAHVAVYKVCWNPKTGLQNSCEGADILAAIDDAVQDGVDVLSMSLAKSNPQSKYPEDETAIGLFHAVEKGIFVACAAGNDGSLGPATASNLAPWIATVSASSVDRIYMNQIRLGDGSIWNGTCMTRLHSLEPWIGGEKAGGYVPLVYGGNIPNATSTSEKSKYCSSPGDLDVSKLDGSQVLVCEYDPETGRVPSVDLKEHVAGLLLLHHGQEWESPLSQQMFDYPATAVSAEAGSVLLGYINGVGSPCVIISYPFTVVGVPSSPMMAPFSSMGPNSITPDVLKPDITAPGAYILAAVGNGLDIKSGTSMACPHVAASAALLRQLYPTWSPAAIRSALMTTATSHDNTNHAIMETTFLPANSFVYGSGLVTPSRAADPGLIYDLGVDDYLGFLCSVGYNSTSIAAISGRSNLACSTLPNAHAATDLNYPSIAASKVVNTLTVSRTVTSVGSPSTYDSLVISPRGVQVAVVPSKLHFKNRGDKVDFQVTFTVNEDSRGQYVFGWLEWYDHTHAVRSPIALVASKQ